MSSNDIRSKKVLFSVGILLIILLLALMLFFVKYWGSQVYGVYITQDNILRSIGLQDKKEYYDLEYVPNQTGVTIYNRNKTLEGYNVFHNKIMSMDGTLLKEFEGVRKIIITDQGLIAGYDQNHVGLYYWNMSPIWENKIKTHHELYEDSDGSIVTLSKNNYEYKGKEIIFDSVLIYSKEGDMIFNWSTFKNLDYIKKFHNPNRMELPNFLLYFFPDNKSKYFYDYYHINSVQPLPKNDLEKFDSRFKQGNLLISLSYVNLVIILDRETKEIVWSWGLKDLEFMHMPRMSKDGTIMIFENGIKRKKTLVLVIDPIKKEIIKTYPRDKSKPIYSKIQGSAQQLSNGFRSK
ncbi:aryl-sulfate sulfotransferase [Candidatus Woesearchaeota archaeon]|nr:aryl-sulfate sulfotransferase [Candidatus Woesearchaeota archaeon]